MEITERETAKRKEKKSHLLNQTVLISSTL
jgi:hypothetical protein